jgi:hypothetical protein
MVRKYFIFIFIFAMFLLIFVLYFCLVHAMSRDEISEGLSNVKGRKEVREMCEGEVNVCVGRGG